MPSRIEDYALIGDCQTAALVSKERLDRLALLAPLRFRGRVSRRCWATRAMAAGGSRQPPRKRRRRAVQAPLPARHADPRNRVHHRRRRRRRRRSTSCRLRGERSWSHLVRLVVGRRGAVPMRTELIVRFGYGAWAPWVTRSETGDLLAIAGPDLADPAHSSRASGRGIDDGRRLHGVGRAADAIRCYLCPSHLPPPDPVDADDALRSTEEFWRSWASACRSPNSTCEIVMRSLITLKALTYAPTGGIVAAPTTSLPEQLGGPRNWDYRYCWLRDATLTLLALMNAAAITTKRGRGATGCSRRRRQPGADPDHVRRRGRTPAGRVRGRPGCRATRTRSPVRIGNAAVDAAPARRLSAK